MTPHKILLELLTISTQGFLQPPTWGFHVCHLCVPWDADHPLLSDSFLILYKLSLRPTLMLTVYLDPTLELIQ